MTDTDAPAGLVRIRWASRLLDSAFRVPGTRVRIGIDPLLGALPVAGDTVTTLVSLYVVLEAYLLGVPGRTLLRMLANVAVDAVLGAVPLLGFLTDAVWRANERNVALVESHVDG